MSSSWPPAATSTNTSAASSTWPSARPRRPRRSSGSTSGPAPPPRLARAGAGLRPLPSADSQRVLTATPDLVEPVRQAFHGIGGLEATYVADRATAGGELVNVLKAGYGSAIGLYGGHRYFHTRGDDVRCVSGDAGGAGLASAFRRGDRARPSPSRRQAPEGGGAGRSSTTLPAGSIRRTRSPSAAAQHLVAEGRAGRAQAGHLRLDVLDDQVDAGPADGPGLDAYGLCRDRRGHPAAAQRPARALMARRPHPARVEDGRGARRRSRSSS